MIFNREEQHLMLEGSVLSKEDVKRLVACHTEEASGFLYELYRFLEEWFSDSPYLTVKTSGSTGTPKLLKVRKEQMMQSARLTCEFWDFDKEIAYCCVCLCNILPGRWWWSGHWWQG